MWCSRSSAEGRGRVGGQTGTQWTRGPGDWLMGALTTELVPMCMYMYVQWLLHIHNSFFMRFVASSCCCSSFTRGGGASPRPGTLTSSPPPPLPPAPPRAAPQLLLAPPPADHQQHSGPSTGRLPFSQPIQDALEVDHELLLLVVHGQQALHGLPQQRRRRGTASDKRIKPKKWHKEKHG